MFAFAVPALGSAGTLAHRYSASSLSGGGPA